jgi:hypothetical protein
MLPPVSEPTTFLGRQPYGRGGAGQRTSGRRLGQREADRCGESVSMPSDFLRGRERELPAHWSRYVPRDKAPAWAAVGWTPISAPFCWSTWTGKALGEMVIMEWDRSGQPKEPADLTHAP